MHCLHCLGDQFHSSRLRVSDIPHLLLFRMPVRCTHCQLRQFQPAGVVRKYVKLKKERRKVA
jgi:hypothetical protein